MWRIEIKTKDDERPFYLTQYGFLGDDIQSSGEFPLKEINEAIELSLINHCNIEYITLFPA